MRVAAVIHGRKRVSTVAWVVITVVVTVMASIIVNVMADAVIVAVRDDGHGFRSRIATEGFKSLL